MPRRLVASVIHSLFHAIKIVFISMIHSMFIIKKKINRRTNIVTCMCSQVSNGAVSVEYVKGYST